MALLNNLVKVAVRPLPKMFSQRNRAFADYAGAASYLAGAVWMWKRNKRAAVAALVCGGAGVAVNLLTDYPGGVKRTISFRRRREIDLGLAAMAATMPGFLAFKDDPEKNFFRAEGVALTVISELTDFSEAEELEQRWAA